MHRINEQEKSHALLEMAVILSFFVWLIWNCFYGERIPEAHGIGFDGVLYASMAEHFPAFIFHHAQSAYSIQRMLPSGIIYYVIRLFHFSVKHEQMPFVFSIYNTVILTLAVYFWHKIANFLRWNGQVRILSFCGLFLNYAILKMNTYDPVLTDTSAFVCSLAMLYFYLTDIKWALLLTTIVGTFIFPTLMLAGLVLFIFLNKDQNKSYRPVENNQFASVILSLVCALLLSMAIFVIYRKWGQQGFALGSYYQSPVLYISLFAVFIFLYQIFYPVVENGKQTVSTVFRQAMSYRLIVAVVLGLFLKFLVACLASPKAGPMTLAVFLKTIFINSLAYPFIFLVSHIIYYGPVVCLIVFFWREVIRYLKSREDTGLFVLAVCYSILLIDTEARQIINFLPVIAIGLFQVLNKKHIPLPFVFSFLGLDLLLSRCWLPLSHGWASLLTNPPEVTLAFPMQWYFMSFGPWMSHSMYLIFLLVSVISLMTIRLFTNKLKPLT
ncbi:MAG TPA: hypothetical protein VLJ15_06260 [Gammaproteobacteria bacterium]|nr:hypothetical protein [Gammaproteobacteria bacterium]